jgi:hypothetical protein
MKSFIALTAATGLITSPVMAGPYANVETNTNRVGDEYQSTAIEKHVGYEGTFGEKGAYFVQGGLTTISTEEDASVEVSGKAGAAYTINERTAVYGEYSFVNGDEIGSTIKTGVKYSF